MRTFAILLGNYNHVNAALVALAKRAARKGLTPIAHTWGKPTTTLEMVPHPVYDPPATIEASVTRIPLTLDGDSPHHAGWTFRAAIEHLDGENIVRNTAESAIPSSYRNAPPNCDHCHQTRKRNETYILQHNDGRIIQVGSTCIDDFLGTNIADRIASQACYFADILGIGEAGEHGTASSNGDDTLEAYLPRVAREIREHGWVSRTKARESGLSLATADHAWANRKDEPSEADHALASQAAAWAESLDSTDDYLHNIGAIARHGIVNVRSNGLAASIIVAYQRSLADAKRQATALLSVHVGTIGERSTRELTLDFLTGYETQYGYTTVCRFKDDTGAILVWKASSTDLARSDVGNRYFVTGTVKDHTEYQGTKQTLLTRCVIYTTPPAIKAPKRRAKASATC